MLCNWHFLCEGEDVPLGRSSSSTRDLDIEPGRVDIYSETPAGALQDIATKCGTKVKRIRSYTCPLLRS